MRSTPCSRASILGPHHGNGVRRRDDGVQSGHGLWTWAGGMIFDTFNDYRWLYIGSLSVGLGAMAVALAFPPLPRRSLERLSRPSIVGRPPGSAGRQYLV